MWFESSVVVATSPDSASSLQNCSLPHLNSHQHKSKGDYCQLVQEVVFPVGVASRTLSIELVDDEVPEGKETFYVQLLEGEGLRNAILSGNVRSKVTITDIEDCEL